tara:strand:- start:330 stop:506 length:177 start_codon:yes stop_codon:yes gene_type:complete
MEIYERLKKTQTIANAGGEGRIITFDLGAISSTYYVLALKVSVSKKIIKNDEIRLVEL